MWRRERFFDPSGAELYLLNSKIETALALASLVFAGIGVALLLRTERRASRSVDGE